MTEQLETRLSRLGERLDRDGEVLEHEVALRVAQPRTRSVARAARPSSRAGAGRKWKVLIAAVVVVGVVVGGVALIRNATRSTPTVQSPSGSGPSNPVTTTVDQGTARVIPKVDVKTLYFPISAGDQYSRGDVGAAVVVQSANQSATPTPDELAAVNACYIGLSSIPYPTHYGYFEDPGWYRGTPGPATFPAPDPPTTAPVCTVDAAKAALKIRELNQFFSFPDAMVALETDPTISAARQQEIDCLHGRGIDGVSEDGFISDGWNQQHPDQAAQAKLDFADCIQPVVDARAQVRGGYRDTVLAVNKDAVDRLQRAFDDYLDAIYNPTPTSPTGGSLDSLPATTFNDGCITVTDLSTSGPTLTEEQIRTATGITGPGLAGVQGTVSVCDKSDITSRPAYIAYTTPASAKATTGELYILDATTGTLLDHRVLKP
jgi:hypothetical protein